MELAVIVSPYVNYAHNQPFSNLLYLKKVTASVVQPLDPSADRSVSSYSILFFSPLRLPSGSYYNTIKLVVHRKRTYKYA